jgi:hypothetical protein
MKGRRIMKKRIFVLVLLPLLVLALVGTSHAWQGRMGGMGDPYGLLSDESDFLIHPAKIAKGEGIKFYGNYRFTYIDVMAWDYNLDQFTPAGVLVNYSHFDTSGQEYNHNALLGAATPLGPGRFGIFFTYDGMRGDYDGDKDILGVINSVAYNLTKDFDNFAVRLLYGLPVWGMDVGLELGMAYRDELQETWWNRTDMLLGSKNYPWSWAVYDRSLFPFMIPYDSNYWELLWRTGMVVKLFPLTIDVGLRGGYIICSENMYAYEYHALPVGTIVENGDITGNVAGWRIGSDIWMRIPAGGGLTIPFLLSFDYADKKRDGDAIGTGLNDAGSFYDYEHKKQMFDIKVGGGIEKELAGNALVAAGLYYNYQQGSDDFRFSNVGYTNVDADSNEFPFHQEHMAILRLAGEKEFSPAVTLRMGFDFFYGWVQEDFEYSRYDGGVFSWSDDVSLNGSHWGIGGSLGGSVQFDSFTMEPFFNVGWQQFDLTGDGDRTVGGVILNLWDMDLSRNEWYIGGGCSFLYDLP